MLRDGTKCVFDPKVFVESLKKTLITNPMIRHYAIIPGNTAIDLANDYKQYMGWDLSQLYVDKTWVDIYYKLESSLDIRLEMTSLEHGSCVVKMSQLAMSSTVVADIMYDKFGMISLPSDPWGFEVQKWLRGKLWSAFVSRDIDILIRLIEDPYLRSEITTTPLKYLLDASIKENWPEATAILMRAIHDRDGETDTAETTLRL